MLKLGEVSRKVFYLVGDFVCVRVLCVCGDSYGCMVCVNSGLFSVGGLGCMCGGFGLVLLLVVGLNSWLWLLLIMLVMLKCLVICFELD